MRREQLLISEKTKDRILNVILLMSLVLLISGYTRPSPSQSPTTPLHSQYTSPALKRLTAHQLPRYQEIAALPASSVGPALNGSRVSPQASGSSSLVVSSNQPRKTTASSTAKTVNAIPVQPTRTTTTITTTVNQVLSLLPLGRLSF